MSRETIDCFSPAAIHGFDSQITRFLPYPPLIIFNPNSFSLKTTHGNFTAMQEIFYPFPVRFMLQKIRVRNVSKQLLDLLSLAHEHLHCYNILGSSLASIYAFSSLFRFDAVNELLTSGNPDLELFNRKVGLANELFCLFYDTRNNEYLPRIKDFEETLIRYIKFVQDWHEDLYGKDDSSQEHIVPLVEEIRSCSEEFPDLLFPLDSFPQRIANSIEKILAFDPAKNAFVLPTISLVEGYAQFAENFFDFHFSHKKRLKKTLQYYEKLKSRRIYRSVETYKASNQLLNLLLAVIEKKRGSESEATDIYTFQAIYEISLMSRLHPALLFDKELPPPKLEEIFIPKRFTKLFIAFAENECTISDFCNPFRNFLSGLDEICELVGWPPYSKTLTILEGYYKSDKAFEGTYFGNLCGTIIHNKLRYKQFFLHNPGDLVDELPIFTFNEHTKSFRGIERLEEDGYFEISEFLHIAKVLIYDTFALEFQNNANSYEKTKYYIDLLFSADVLKDFKKDFVEQSGLDRYLSLNSTNQSK